MIPEAFATCLYCRGPTRLGDSREVYGKSYGPALLCAKYPACDAFVGCHATTGAPKGLVANATCREWRKKAHALFDLLWKSVPGVRAKMTRAQAYAWLAEKTSTTPEQCHIGMMEPDQCWKVIRACRGLPVTGALYVDFMVNNGWVIRGRTVPNCHMYCDGTDLTPLHAVAAKLFLKPEWLDDKGVVPHYDLMPSKRVLALAAGVVPLDTRAAFARVYRPVRDMWVQHKHSVNPVDPNLEEDLS